MKNKEQDRQLAHIISLVLGIISAITTFFWYISLPTGITAIVLGARSYKKDGKKLGIAGLITGIVGVAFCLLIYITLVIILLLENASVF